MGHVVDRLAPIQNGGALDIAWAHSPKHMKLCGESVHGQKRREWTRYSSITRLLCRPGTQGGVQPYFSIACHAFCRRPILGAAVS
eukprot:154237-Amphidinium_carterae.1